MKLFTNFDYMTLKQGEYSVRVMGHALLIQPHDNLFGPKDAEPTFKLRGFSVDGAAPVFDLVIPSDEYETRGWHGNAIMIREDQDEPQQIFQGEALAFKDGPEIALWIEDDSKPICVDEFPDDLDHEGYDTLWATVNKRVAEHWTAPNMPVLKWLPAKMVREAYAAQLDA